jgi:hypothetical protein
MSAICLLFPGSRVKSEFLPGTEKISGTDGLKWTKVFRLSTAATTSTASAGVIRRLEIASAKRGYRDGRSAGGSFWRAASRPLNWKRHEADVFACPGRWIVAPL